MKKIPYGISDYETLITNDYYYVDKTMYLSTLENVGRTLVYLRPRRFGKTLFTSMMYYYYDINSKNKFNTLFKDTYVYNKQTSNKNNYYVLKFDFSGMSSTTNGIIDRFKNNVIVSINNFLNYYKLEYEIDKSLLPADIILNFFSYLKGLELKHKIYIIIDEYDNFTNAILGDNNVNLFKSILGKNSFVKDFYARIKEYSGTIIDRVFITGVCSISLDAVTSGFNIAINITTDSRFNAMTALTHKEVKTLIEEVDKDNKDKIFKEILENYDGYCFSDDIEELVFNPTLTMYYLNNISETGKPPKNLLDKNILSSYDQIKNIISLGNYKEVLKDILDNEEIESELITNFELNTSNFNKDDIVSLLFYFGYLTINRLGINGLVFNIPNNVIRSVFISYFKEVLLEVNVKIDNESANKALVEMANTGKIDKITNCVSSIIKQDSFRDYMGISEIVIKQIYLTLLNNNNAFDIISELEVNNGYIDLYFKNKNNLSIYNILIELKYIKKKDRKLLNMKKEEGIIQINKYILDKKINKDNLCKYIVIFIGNDYKIIEV